MVLDYAWEWRRVNSKGLEGGFYLGGTVGCMGISFGLSCWRLAGLEEEELPRSAFRRWEGSVEGVGSTWEIQLVRRIDSGFTVPSALS